VAADGHVNLLPSGRHRRRAAGDSAGMVRSRRRFLEAGHYDPLAVALVDAVEQATTHTPVSVLLDAGCGEGFFTRALRAALPSSVDVCGIDVSKPAVTAAAKRDPGSTYAVASAFDLPVLDGSVDLIVSNFSPVDGADFSRALREGGLVVAAHPGPDHLFALRALVYDEPRPHEPKGPLRHHPDLFEVAATAEVRAPLHLTTSDDVANLLAMTPYFWQADEAKQARIATLPGLDTELHVLLTTYRRRPTPTTPTEL
jgi:23S rRNA (guanine745-N1)-methyltransferase